MEKKFAPAAAKKKFSAKTGNQPWREEGRRQDNAPRKRDFGPRPPMETGAEKGERIAKRLARLGLASRREAEMMIAAGRVAVNGRVLASPAVNVLKTDSITVDGQALPVKERTRLWLYHKPAGLITTARDEEGRPTVFDNLPEGLPRVLSVGRLDMNTEGLLLLTNDGGLARILELPSTGWARHYRARAHGAVTQKQLDSLKDGIAVDGIFYGAVEARLEREQGSNVWLSISLREGKNREIKNILGALGLTVNRLIRVSFGPFQLADLEAGQAREVRGRTLRDQLGDRLAEEADLDFDAPIITGRSNAAAGAEKPADFTERRVRRPAPAAADGWVSSGSRPRAPAEPRQKPQERQTRKANVWHAPGSKMRPAKSAEFAAADERRFAPQGKVDAGGRRAGRAERPGYQGERRPRAERYAEEGGRIRKPFGEKREFADKKPFGDRRPAGQKLFAAKPFAKKSGRFAESEGSARREAGKAWDKNPRGGKPFGEKRPFGDKKPFADRRDSGKAAFNKTGRPSGKQPSGGRPNGGRPAGSRPKSGGIRGRHADNRR